MSTNLRELIDEVSKQKRHNKKCHDNIDIFWKEIDDFNNHSDPYSFQSGWFANDYAQYERYDDNNYYYDDEKDSDKVKIELKEEHDSHG